MKFKRGASVTLDPVSAPCCPITSTNRRVGTKCMRISSLMLRVFAIDKEKNYPFEVELDDRTETRGCILCFQVRTIDATKRGAYFLEKAPEDIFEQCAEYLSRLIRADI